MQGRNVQVLLTEIFKGSCLPASSTVFTGPSPKLFLSAEDLSLYTAHNLYLQALILNIYWFSFYSENLS